MNKVIFYQITKASYDGKNVRVYLPNIVYEATHAQERLAFRNFVTDGSAVYTNKPTTIPDRMKVNKPKEKKVSK